MVETIGTTGKAHRLSITLMMKKILPGVVSDNKGEGTQTAGAIYGEG